MISTLKQNKKKIFTASNIQLSILALPAVLQILIFAYLPMIGIVIAFKNLDVRAGFLKSPWVGFDNFKFFFSYGDAWRITRNTLGYNLTFIIIGTIVSIIFALLLNEVISRKAVKTYQTILFIPYLLSWVIVSYMLYSFISPNYGILKPLFLSFGIENIDVYSNKMYWPFIFVITSIWKGVGFSSVMYYATVIGIDPEYYEAAQLDGATKPQMALHITLPLLIPMICILTLMSLGRIFYSDFGMFFFLPNNIGGLYDVTQVMDTYIYNSLKGNGDIGMASAAGFFQSIMGFITVNVANFVVKKIDNESSLF